MVSKSFVEDCGATLETDERALRTAIASWSSYRIRQHVQWSKERHDALTHQCVSVALGRVQHERDLAELEMQAVTK